VVLVHGAAAAVLMPHGLLLLLRLRSFIVLLLLPPNRLLLLHWLLLWAMLLGRELLMYRQVQPHWLLSPLLLWLLPCGLRPLLEQETLLLLLGCRL
jgi:hypothetical protein